MTEGKIVAWNAAEGDRLAKGDPVVVVESDKADMDVETFHDGFLAAVLVPAGESAPVGSAIALLAESEEEIPLARSQAANFSSSAAASPPAPQETVAQETSPAPPPPAPVAVSAPALPSPATQGGARVVASPYAKKLAKELSVDLFAVSGSGPGGRVVAKDVEAAAAAPKKAGPEPAARPDVPLGSTAPFTTMQGAVSKNMVESLAVPAFRVGYTITTDALDVLYKKIKAKGVTMTALLAKATAMALVQHPVVNSSCRDGQSFTYNSSINIAVAVAIDGGLITPVLQDADKVECFVYLLIVLKLDIYSLSRKWKELVDKARAKQLQPQEYNSGTFTLSNLGMFGVDRFDAILPPGTGAIMAVGSSQPTVVGTKDGRIGIKSQMQIGVRHEYLPECLLIVDYVELDVQWKQSKPAALIDRLHKPLKELILASISIAWWEAFACKSRCFYFYSLVGSHCLQSCGMAAASSGRAEVDTSRAFRSVKEAVAVFGERILAKEAQFRPGAHANHRVVRERSSWRDSVAIASSKEKLEGSSDLIKGSHSTNPNAVAASSSPSLAHDDDYDKQIRKESNLMTMSSIKKVEEEAAKTRLEAVQVKRRLADLELAMANLNAKLHRALSRLAYIEADKAAAARASIQQRDINTSALTVWAKAKPERHPLRHLLSLDDADEEVKHGPERETTMTTIKRKMQKQKPIMPLVVPLISDVLFSKKKRMNDKESLYLKELYSLLRLS
ncbi:unnamed protein product [Triticum turgidum subsp. durum]|uniref:Dihydrolipoamide acetyltransferase component of pyruvate dehydrogenase complex n=1 Tax=Triticum turgidum subsp. durum TaxID=4567 RepID=A0A9R0WLT8_TRITD|nr:unnamed protein product [Triticum turgidum subsp. durum]